MSGFAINGVYPSDVHTETPYIPEDFADAFPNDPDKQKRAADAKNQAYANEKAKKKPHTKLIDTAKGIFKQKNGGSSAKNDGPDHEDRPVEHVLVKNDQQSK